MIVHRPRRAPGWWLVLIAVVVIPFAVGHDESGWIILGAVWLAVAGVLIYRSRRRRQGERDRRVVEL
ncbi:MAG TPA: DUF6232 family protein [Gaiellales bacterium]|nr:DUF6232 family protein [Gaiellales bacterium]